MEGKLSSFGWTYELTQEFKQYLFENSCSYQMFCCCVECNENWIHYEGHCYKLNTADTLLTWMLAEQECVAIGGHLASIMTRREMLFIHSILLKFGITTDGVYIGKFQYSHCVPFCRNVHIFRITALNHTYYRIE